ncbi:septal ring lytic transglycosylase RlpA family protein [Flexithrix dorotheae]|uniref:septal ring lytic transglycosylase RlpA family protein n=1 Tax=Flexithrix dorotheae TaxID=70993 RepID=UPI00035F6FF1|nr:septal ring lytic transglycosylase RlpA family protein [Flexithrix dorotheae]
MKNFFVLFLFYSILNTPLFSQDIGFKEKGEASYYNDKLQGRPTASGEPYDKAAFTLAHRTLPFGTVVKITNLETSQATQARVNDRGPHKEGRIVDLSRAAAAQIGLVKAGVAQVEIEVLGLDPGAAAMAPAVENPQVVQETETPAVSTALPTTQPLTEAQQNALLSTAVVPVTEPATVQALEPNAQANYYDESKNGEITVTGETHNMYALTASHNSFPLNSLVKVINVANGKEVLVRVNDRPKQKPESGEDIITLSYAAANQLGIIGMGQTPVNLEVVFSGDQQLGKGAAVAGVALSKEEQLLKMFAPVKTYLSDGTVMEPTGYGIQVGAYGSPMKAQEIALRFEKFQFKYVFIQAGWRQSQKEFRVIIGQFPTQEDGSDLLEILKGHGFDAFIKKHMEGE